MIKSNILNSLPYEDIRQSAEWFDFWNRLGWTTLHLNQGQKVLFSPNIFCSALKVEKPYTLDAETLLELDYMAKLKKIAIIRIKPYISQDSGIIDKFDYGKIRKPIGATKTGIIDLKLAEEDLWKNLTKTARYLIRSSAKNEILITFNENPTEHDLRNFCDIYEKSGRTKHFITLPEKSFWAFSNAFAKKISLVSAFDKNGKLLGGCLFAFHDKTAWYMFAGRTKEGTKHSVGYPILWEGIKYLKSLRYEFLDLEGLADERYGKYYKGHEGYSFFKECFGPDLVYFPEERVKYFNPIYKTLDGILY